MALWVEESGGIGRRGVEKGSCWDKRVRRGEIELLSVEMTGVQRALTIDAVLAGLVQEDVTLRN